MGGRGRGRGRGRGGNQGQQNQSNRPGQQQGPSGDDFPPIAQLHISSPQQSGHNNRGIGRGRGQNTSPRDSSSSSVTSTPTMSPAGSQPSTPNMTTATASSSGSGSSLPPSPVVKAPEQPEKIVTQGAARCQFPARNGFGTKGKPMKVDSNHFMIQVMNKQMIITHYDVDMKMFSEKDGSLKDCPKKYLKPGIIAFGRQAWPQRFPAFDGTKNLFSCGNKLVNGSASGEVFVQNSERVTETGALERAKLKVTVKEVNTISLTDIGQFMRDRTNAKYPALAIQALDIVLRNAGNTRLLQVGRSFYSAPKGQIISLGNGVDLWFGVFQSATLGGSSLYLNVDVAHKGFPKAQSLRDLISDLGAQPGRYNEPPTPFDADHYEPGRNPRLDDKLRVYLKGLKVEYEIPRIANSKRVYRVVDVVQAADKLKFTIDQPNGGKKQTTVAQYYEQERNYRMQYPYWPCLHVGNKDRQIYVPIELCRVAAGQVTIRKLDEEQTRNMVKNAATKPFVRRKKIMEAFNNLNLGQDPCLKEFGISVGGCMTEVNGRILSAPALQYQGPREVLVANGEWKINNQKFQKPGKAINSWAIVDLCGLRNEINDIANSFPQAGQQLGMVFSGKPQIFTSGRLNRKMDLERFLSDTARKGKFDLMVVVIPDYIGGASPYPSVKQVLELDNKILTQCIKQKTVRKLTPPTVTNLLLKINAKMDGINHSLHARCRPACFNVPIMIMGADVTHPPPDSKTSPSVAAVTASHDPNALFQYNMQWRLQPPKVEEILDMEEITYQHLRFFANKTNGQIPQRIIFYRDGVSDGQFEMVLRCELTAIRRAIKRFKPDYNPQITFLVVQKRHHTRFFPKDRDPLADRNGNVPAGFVVDNTITHPRDLDFYLVSHQSIQGTSRPTKYKMLYDDAKMTEDQIEELTYYLCHLFTRCNRSVSYPAPTYYAHLAAFRAKSYIEGKQIDVSNERVLKTHSIKLNDAMIEFNKLHPMFFV